LVEGKMKKELSRDAADRLIQDLMQGNYQEILPLLQQHIREEQPQHGPQDTPRKRALSEKEAADYLGISAHTLRQGRCDGQREGRMPIPPHYKIGKKIIYMEDELAVWLLKFRIVA
jgi:hypothetical protein